MEFLNRKYADDYVFMNLSKSRFLFIIAIAFFSVSHQVKAQVNISSIEYFIDTDPGVGNGVPVTGFTSAASIDINALNIATTSLTAGNHLVCLRAKDTNGNWGFYECRPFYVQAAVTPSTVSSGNITQLEYFFDTAPAPGSGTPISFTAGTEIDISALAIPTTSLSTGWHTLGVRGKNANGDWGFYEVRMVYIQPTITPVTVSSGNITQLEYFFDTAPAPGSGTPISFTAGTEIDISALAIPTTSLSTGWHTLGVRGKNANGDWGFYEVRMVYIQPTITPVTVSSGNITQLEYFFDTAPAPGNGTPISFTAGTEIDISALAIPTTSLATGWHTLGVRGKNANSDWGFYEVRTIYIQPPIIPPSTTPSPIVSFEYFIDNDPGVGNGTFSIPVSPASASVSLVDQNLNVGSLALGSHSVTIRGKNQNNEWGFYEVRAFSVCNQPPTTLSATTAVSTSGFTINFTAANGATSFQLDVSKDNFATYVSGYNNKTIVSLTETITGLSSATTYQYRVRAVSTCASDYVTGSTTTLLTIPTSQPGGLSITSSSTALAITFSAASGSPSGYIALRKAGISPTFLPVNNTAYTLGESVADGSVVAYVGSAPAFLDSGLTPDTEYYYDIFSYNQSGALYSYLTSLAPLQGNRKTLALEPAAQPTAISFSDVTYNGFTVSFIAAAGNPTGYLVLRSTGISPAAIPVDGTTYTTAVGSDAVVHNSSATTFTQSGLSQNTEYYYSIYSYNGSGTSINYRTIAPLTGNQLTPITPPASPSNLVFSNVTPNSITVSYSAPTGSVTGYLVIRKTGSNPSFVPQLNTTYTAGQSVNDGTVVYVGPLLSFTDNGLSGSTEYFYDVFAYNVVGSLTGYQTNPLEGSKTTFTAEPVAQPTALLFSNVSTTTMTIVFSAANPASAGYLILRKTGSTAVSTSIDGTPYARDQSIGDGTVVYSGASTTFIDTGLLPGTTYFYQVFSYSGSGAATNYLTSVTSANSGSKITIPDLPVFSDATGIGQNQFTINWVAVTGANNYKLDVSLDDFATQVAGFNDVTLTGSSALISGLERGTLYKYRLRAVNASGTSVNSNTGQQFTIPSTPVLTASSNVGQNEFTANWNAVSGATNYFIDVSLSNTFNTYEVGYENKSTGNLNTMTISGLTPGTAYYYRVRSFNSGGTSPNSSPSGIQLLIPATPVGLDATNTTTNSFKAKWQAVAGAIEYRIDVTLASNNFSPSLPGYTNLLTSTNTEELIINLSPNTAYRYRLRAVNAAGTSLSSTPISVSTQAEGTGTPLQLSTPVYSSSFLGTPTNASIEVSGGAPPYSISFYYRKIATNDYTVRTLTSTGSKYETIIDATMLDEMGVEFYFKVMDTNETSKETQKQFIYRAVTATGLKIPFTKSGGTAQSYELFSIPYQLSENGIEDIFNELLPYEKSRWRLVRYQGDKNVDFGSGLNRIELGKGYWFNRKESIDIFFSNGTVANVNQTKDAEIPLEKGWNQIGNPLPYDIDWDDILASNSTVKLISSMKVFNPVQLHLNDESNNLKSWSGGFVHNGNEVAVTLKVPVILKNSAGGRKKSSEIANRQLDQPEWFVPITISQGEVFRDLSGIGMHPEASLTIDRFDDLVVPRFLNYTEFFVRHEDFFTPKFAKDIVPTTSSFTWSINFESSKEDENITLNWDNTNFGTNEAQLLLQDVSNNTIVNMKMVTSYTFKKSGSHPFKIYYGKSSSDIKPDMIVLGNAYPNPFNSITGTNIPFIIHQTVSEVMLNVTDLMGRQVVRLADGIYSNGIHHVVWDGKDTCGEQSAQGMYLYRLEVDGQVIIRQLIKN